MSNLALIPASKSCTKCKEEKEFSEYAPRKRGRYGLNSWCRDCVNLYYKDSRAKNPVPSREAGRRHERRNPKDGPNRYLKRKYGITLEQKQQMYDRQNGICAICPNRLVDLSGSCVDHDHKTGKIRDLLCHNCNVSLGLLKEDKQRIENVRLYIAKHDGSFAEVSKFASYIKEREGFDVFETREGYASYKIQGDECYIKDIFTLQVFRNRGCASTIANSIAEIAKNAGCKYLTGSICPSMTDPTTSAKVLISYGFILHSAVPNGIIFRKDL